MTIDRPNNTLILPLRHLWQEAFGDSDAFLDGFFSTGFSSDRCRCVTYDGRLAAALYWFDCTLDGKKLAYIYAVATDKAFRGRGLCRALMEDTHRHLQELGYSGATLVPGNKGLFDLYEKLGYRRFCPMKTLHISPAAPAATLKRCSAGAFSQLRVRLLPAGGLLQEGATLDYLAAFTEFYTGDSCLMCLSKDVGTVYFQEYLGQEAQLPGIIAALGAQMGVVRVPGGDPYAMYYPLVADTPSPVYLGLALN